MSDDLRELCEQLVPRVLTQRGYGLVENMVEFVAEVLVEVQARLPNNHRPEEKIVEDAVINRYGYIWLSACRSDGTLRQRQAFEELHRYLYPIARHHAGRNTSTAEDSAQDALLIVWQQLDRVRDPGAFARFASVIVYHEVIRRLKKEQPSVDPDSETGQPGITQDEPDREPGGQSDPSPESTPVMTAALRVKLEAAIRECLPTGAQPAVIIELFFNEKGFKQVADELSLTVENVSVLKSRALKKLKECQNFLDVLEELL